MLSQNLTGLSLQLGSQRDWEGVLNTACKSECL